MTEPTFWQGLLAALCSAAADCSAALTPYVQHTAPPLIARPLLQDSHIENAILDKNARVGKNVRITNKDGVDEFEPADGGPEQYMIRSGIVVVMKGGVIPDGTVI